MKYKIVIVLISAFFFFSAIPSKSKSDSIADRSNDHIDTIVLKQPVVVKIIPEEINDTGVSMNKILTSWLPWFIGIVGFIFGVYDRFKKSEIGIKIISQSSTYGSFKSGDFSIEGLKYYTKYSINVTKKDLVYKDVKVYVKYHNDNKVYKGVIYCPRNDMWSDGRKLSIHNENNLYLNSVLTESKPVFMSLAFIVEGSVEHFAKMITNKPDPFNFEYIQLEFISSKKSLFGSNNSISTEKIFTKETEVQKLIYEDDIWVNKV